MCNPFDHQTIFRTEKKNKIYINRYQQTLLFIGPHAAWPVSVTKERNLVQLLHQIKRI